MIRRSISVNDAGEILRVFADAILGGTTLAAMVSLQIDSEDLDLAWSLCEDDGTMRRILNRLNHPVYDATVSLWWECSRSCAYPCQSCANSIRLYIPSIATGPNGAFKR